jgi:mRNA-degrading endonuclease RelE of RelBE toxin-antitoxin system
MTPSYKLEYTKLFLKKLKRIDKKKAERILNAVERILKEPYNGSLLAFAREKCRKWKVEEYRIIYKIIEKEHKVVLIVVDHRKKVYKRYKL